MPSFDCRTCGTSFSLPQSTLDRFPGWTPQACRNCRDASKKTKSGGSKAAATVQGSGPGTGVFTDGGASPNPGPGGWGAVYVIDGQIVTEKHGHEPTTTTNNRMELTALIEGAALVPEGTAATVYSDSNLAVRTITEWAAGWERNGWKRKAGPVENLDLVKVAYATYKKRPELTVQWIKGHAGARWNEYADELANRWR